MSFLKTVSEFSSFLGKNPLLVQGAGGNVSWKDGDALHIKASGKWLSKANHENIFVELDLKKITEEISKGVFKLPLNNNQCLSKPSIETLLHALMPQKFVAHLHCVNSISQLIQFDWSSRVKLALPFTNDYLLVDYYKPGEELAENVLLEIQKNGPRKIIFLRNHGVIYGADSIEELQQLIHETSAAFELKIRDILQNRIKKISSNNEDFNHAQLTNFKNPAYDAVKNIEEFWECLEKIWEIVPDHVVFLHKPKRFDSVPNQKLIRDLDFIFQDKNCLIQKNISLVKLEQLIFYFNVIVRVEHFSNINVLNQQQILAIRDWDAEKYRSIIQTQYR